MTDKKLAKRFSIPPEKKHVYDYLEEMSQDRSKNMSFFIVDLVEKFMNEEQNGSPADIVSELKAMEQRLNLKLASLSGANDNPNSDTQNTEQELTDDDINDLMTF